MGQTTVVDVNTLSRSFHGKRALDGVSFSATAGQVYGLVGANGAGKTTLLKHLLGLLRAATGSVRVLGLDPVRDPVGVLGRVGYLSEERELPEWMRVDELMAYTQAFHRTWDETYARQMLESFALDPSKKIRELSKGMRAQAGLIAAEHAHGSRLGAQQTEEMLDQRRLAGAVGADEAVDLAGGGAEGDAVECAFGAERSREVVDVDNGLFHG